MGGGGEVKFLVLFLANIERCPKVLEYALKDVFNM